ncbi:putative bifunctional diguanylate cyclase/phosphodiesterase [Reinekea marinisedimentorum]|uniref:EAL domain-containing protein (Putative c-di-GMP-specific phosphodiesterase class I) n=1 Tax=Reinekea marinisedimentorum TaxID=230495 RepID=A0A4R3HZV1_9GAMM|nr:bifunctional diguanylate cyclase/phosphodiesterase [Reinekea marinisedimentorum]TCS38233.1 EAL domain-containing protein (putative c-di-GMP-specific phosphodiesterase class I) [Reinekea marinisedimentorum]
MNARRSLFALVFVALVVLLVAIGLGIKLSRLASVTNSLVVAYDALGQWVEHAEHSLSATEVLDLHAGLLIDNLPETLGEEDLSAAELTAFIQDYPLDQSDLARATELQSMLVWELFECHRLQVYFTQLINYARAGLTLLLLSIAGMAFFMGRRAQDYRLAPFPEDNPNPVLGLTYSGKLIYQNSAALSALKQLMPDCDDATQMLPEDYKERLYDLKREKQTQAVWIRHLEDRIYQFSVQLLKNHGRIHIYGEDITEQEQIRARNAFIAYHDPVCLLANRQRYEQLVDEVKSQSLDLTLIITRVSGTSAVLSSQGLEVADQYVRELSMRLRTAYQAVDTFGERKAVVIRFDNSRFGCLYFGKLSDRQYRYLAKLLDQCAEAPFVSDTREHYFKLESGAVCEKSSQSSQFIMQRANIALSTARSSHESFLLFDESVAEKLLEAERIQQELRYAVQLDELSIHYQPQQDLRTGELVGFEALMRWNNKGQSVPPSVFIPIAERTGLIQSMGNWGMREVLRQSVEWQKHPELKTGKIAFNVSAQEFSRQDFIESIEVALVDYPALPESIQVELTESILVEDERAAIETMHTLKSLGFTLAIDDFGTGYSSFSYLSRFPVDKLKIDRSFIVNIARGERDIAIIAAMVDVAHQLGIKVIAEGVETQEEKDVLIRLGCDQIQGYFYGKPMSATDATLFCSNKEKA